MNCDTANTLDLVQADRLNTRAAWLICRKHSHARRNKRYYLSALLTWILGGGE